MRRRISIVPCLLAALAVAACAPGSGADPAPGLLAAGAAFGRALGPTAATGGMAGGFAPPGAIGSPLALSVVALAGGDAKPKRGRRAANVAPPIAFTPERAQVLLRSLTVPGWGQATLGRRTAATVFGVLEAGIWSSFVAFRVQESLRMHSAIRTARLFAGIELEGRDDSYRRLVGDYPSSDDYNLFVVYRDAANQFYDDPALFEAWVARHEVKGADAWSWDTAQHFQQFRDQVKGSQRAGLRANTALALAIANRIASALHAARYAGGTPEAPRTGVRLEPSFGIDGASLALRARF
jgi:hypothetical protein